MSFYENYEKLLQAVQDAWNGQYDVDRFRMTLRSYQVALINPSEKAPEQKDKQYVEGGVVKVPDMPEIKLKDEAQIKFILSFAKSLNLNEIEAVRLFWLASEKVSKRLKEAGTERAPALHIRATVQEVAYELYYTKRINLLVAILDLIEMYQSHDFPPDMVSIVNEYVQELIREKFVTNLIALIKSLLNATSTECKKHRHTEIWCAVQVLFRLFQKRQISSAEAVLLVDLIKTSSASLLQHRTDQNLGFTCYVLLCSLMTAMDTKFHALCYPQDEYGSGDGMSGRSGDLGQFIQDLTQAGLKRDDWQNPEFWGWFALVFSVFLKRAKRQRLSIDTNDAQVARMCTEALECKSNLFWALQHHFLTSRKFEENPKSYLMCEVLCDFLNSFVTFCGDEIEAELNQSSMKIMLAEQQPQTQNFQPSSENYFSVALLSVISHVCKKAPSTVGIFWSNPDFRLFLTNNLNDKANAGLAAVSLSSAMLPAYVQLLQALASDGHIGCQEVYEQLQKSLKLTWDEIFTGFQHILAKFLPPRDLYSMDDYDDDVGDQMSISSHYRTRRGQRPAQRNTVPKVSLKEVSIIKCMLRLVKAVVKDPDLKQIMFNKSDYKVMDKLFGLLGCKFPASLKAEVVSTITAFANGSDHIASIVWERVERSQILPTIPLSGIIGGDQGDMMNTGFDGGRNVNRGDRGNNNNNNRIRDYGPSSAGNGPSRKTRGGGLDGQGDLGYGSTSNRYMMGGVRGAGGRVGNGLSANNRFAAGGAGGAAGSSLGRNDHGLGSTLGARRHQGGRMHGGGMSGDGRRLGDFRRRDGSSQHDGRGHVGGMGGGGGRGGGGGGGGDGRGPRAGSVRDDVGGGLLYDLEQVETPNKTYPLTSAFLQLILTLLYSTRVPVHLGTNYRLPGLIPYVDFVLRHVFLKLDHRQYNDVQERWLLGETCLAIFAKLVGDFNPDQDFKAFLNPYSNEGGDVSMSTDGNSDMAGVNYGAGRSGGFELMSELLNTNNTNFLDKILAVFTSSHEKLQGLEAGTNDEEVNPHSCEASALFALQLLRTALSHEDLFLLKLRREKKDARVQHLSDVLLCREKEVVATAKVVAYVQNHTESFAQILVARQRALSYYMQKRIRENVTGLNKKLTQAELMMEATKIRLMPSDIQDFISNSDIAFYAASIILFLAQRDDERIRHMFSHARASTGIVLAFSRQLHNAQRQPEHLDSSADLYNIDDPTTYYDDETDMSVADAARALGPLLSGSRGLINLDRARIAILELLVTTVQFPGVNLAHLLLGFQVENGKRGVRNTDLNNTSREPYRLCLDEIISLMSKPRFAYHFSALAEACLELFYKLMSTPSTYKSFVRFIQNRHELFFFNLLDHLPSPNEAGDDINKKTNFLQQRAWLLRTLALELYLTSSREENWNHYIDRGLFQLGFLQGVDELNLMMDEKYGGVLTGNRTISSRMLHSSAPSRSRLPASGSGNNEQNRMRVLELLDMIHVPIPPDPPALPVVISGIKTSRCKIIDPARPHSFQYNIKMLYGLALRTFHPPTAAEIVAVAVRWNKINILLAACQDSFKGWRQMVEICLYSSFDPTRDPDLYEGVLFDLLMGLLQKLSSDDRVWICLGDQLSAVAFAVLGRIREQAGFSSGRHVSQNHAILELLLDAIANHRHHITRAHLYGMVANYIQYTQELFNSTVSSANSGAGLVGMMGVGREMDLSGFGAVGNEMTQEQRYLEAHNLQLLESFKSESFLNVVCQDVLEGKAHLRSMALVFLTAVVGYTSGASIQHHAAMTLAEAQLDDPYASPSWINSLGTNGTISHLLSQLLQRSNVLSKAVLSHDLADYHQILNYESMLAFLIQVAQTHQGCQRLMEHDVVGVLSNCSFLGQQPIASSTDTMSGMDEFSSPIARHRQLLIPALRLLVAMLSPKASVRTLHGRNNGHNRELHQQVVDFLMAHNEVVVSILRDQAVDKYQSSLETLNLLTAVIYYLHNGPCYPQKMDDIDIDADIVRQINKYNSALLRLVRRYLDPNNSARLRRMLPSGMSFDTLERQLGSIDEIDGMDVLDNLPRARHYHDYNHHHNNNNNNNINNNNNNNMNNKTLNGNNLPNGKINGGSGAGSAGGRGPTSGAAHTSQLDVVQSKIEHLVNEIARNLLAIFVKKIRAHSVDNLQLGMGITLGSHNQGSTSGFYNDEKYANQDDDLDIQAQAEWDAVEQQTGINNHVLLFGPQLNESDTKAMGGEFGNAQLSVLITGIYRILAKLTNTLCENGICVHTLENFYSMSESDVVHVASTQLHLDLDLGQNLDLNDNTTSITAAHRKRTLAYQQLVGFLTKSTAKLHLCFYILEHSLQLLYHHMALFLKPTSRLLSLSARSQFYRTAKDNMDILLERLQALLVATQPSSSSSFSSGRQLNNHNDNQSSSSSSSSSSSGMLLDIDSTSGSSSYLDSNNSGSGFIGAGAGRYTSSSSSSSSSSSLSNNLSGGLSNTSKALAGTDALGGFGLLGTQRYAAVVDQPRVKAGHTFVKTLVRKFKYLINEYSGI